MVMIIDNILYYNVTVGEQLSEDFQKLLKPHTA